jgi:hypothetical protein
MNPGDTYFLLLYLVGVFQPVAKRDLFREATKAAATTPPGGLDLGWHLRL